MTVKRYALYIQRLDASRRAVDGVTKDWLELDDETNTATLCITGGAALVYAAPSLLNSWVNFGGSWATAGYVKDDQGVVRLKGLVKDGNRALGTPIFKLPVGYRSSEDRVFSVNTFNGVSLITARVDVAPNGDVKVGVQDSNVENTWLSLEGISFVAV